jgi:hypothetical protein
MMSIGAPLGAQTDACATEVLARQANDATSKEMTDLITEVRSVNDNFEAALEAKAKEAGWSETRVAAFRRQLLTDEKLSTLRSQRDKESRSLMLDSLGLVASLGKEPIVLCQDAARARATMKRLRAVLDREYAAIRDALWNSP